MNPEDYDFYSENDKQQFIMDTFFDHMFICPNCSEAYVDVDGAYDCCHTDCYEQDKYYIEEEQADFRMRQEKGD